MLFRSLVRGADILPVWQWVLQAMADDGRRPCDTRLMYRPATGEPSWGAWYMTAPASWLVLNALLDLRYEPGEQLLRLAPALDGTLPVVHPLFHGTARRDADGACRLIIRQVHSDTHLRVSQVESRTADGRAYVRQELNPTVTLVPDAHIDLPPVGQA